MGVNRSTQTGEQEDESERQPEQENQQNGSIATAAGVIKSSSRLKTCATVGVGFGVAVGAVGAVMVAPVVLAGAGFGAAGVTAGSLAAWLQSSIGAVTAGSWFAACQSAGAAGLAATTSAGIGVAGGTLGGRAGGAAESIISRLRFKRLIYPKVDKSTQLSSRYAEVRKVLGGKK